MRYVLGGEDVSKEQFYKELDKAKEEKKQEEKDSSSSSGGSSSSSSSGSGDPRDAFRAEAERRGYYTQSGKIKASKLSQHKKLYEAMVKNPRELKAYQRGPGPSAVVKPRQPGETSKEYEQRASKAVRERAGKTAEKAAASKAAQTGGQASAAVALSQRRDQILRQKAAEKISKDLELQGTDLRDPTRTLQSVRQERAFKQRVGRQVVRDLKLGGTDLTDPKKTLYDVKTARDRGYQETSPPNVLLSPSAREEYQEGRRAGQTTTPQQESDLEVPGFYNASPNTIRVGEGSGFRATLAGETLREFGAGFTFNPSPTTNLRGGEGFEAAITGRNPRTGRSETRGEQSLKSTAWLSGTVLAIGSAGASRGLGQTLKFTKLGQGLEWSGRIFQNPFVRGGATTAAAGGTALTAAQSESATDFARSGANIVKNVGIFGGLLSGTKGARSYARVAREARARAKMPVVLDRGQGRGLEALQQRAIKAGGKLELKITPLESIRGVGYTSTGPRGTLTETQMRAVKGSTRTVNEIPKTGRYTMLDTKTREGVLIQPRPPRSGAPGTRLPAPKSATSAVAPRQYAQTSGRQVDFIKTSALQRQLSSPLMEETITQYSRTPSTTGAGVNRFQIFKSRPYTFDIKTTGSDTPIIQKKLSGRALKALKGFQEYRYNFESGRQVAKGFAWDRADLLKQNWGVRRNPVYVLEQKPKVVPKSKGTSFAQRSFERARARFENPSPENVAQGAAVASTIVTGGNFLKALSQQAQTTGLFSAAAAAPSQASRTVATAETTSPTGAGARGVTPSGARGGAGEIPVGGVQGPTAGVRPSGGAKGGVVGGTPDSGVIPVGGRPNLESDDSTSKEVFEEVGSKPAKAKTPAKLDPSSNTRYKDIIGSKTGARAIAGARTGAGLRSDVRPRTSGLSASKTDAVTDTATDTKLDMTTKTTSVPVTTNRLTTPTKGVYSKPKTPRPPIPRLPRIPIRNQGFQRRQKPLYQAMVKVGGRWQTVGVGPSKKAARGLASLFTQRTPSASFGVKKKGGKDFEKLGESRRFRKRKKGGNILVERSKYRIDTPGEFGGITFKGVRSQKKKGKKKGGLKL